MNTNTLTRIGCMAALLLLGTTAAKADAWTTLDSSTLSSQAVSQPAAISSLRALDSTPVVRSAGSFSGLWSGVVQKKKDTCANNSPIPAAASITHAVMQNGKSIHLIAYPSGTSYYGTAKKKDFNAGRADDYGGCVLEQSVKYSKIKNGMAKKVEIKLKQSGPACSKCQAQLVGWAAQ